MGKGKRRWWKKIGFRKSKKKKLQMARTAPALLIRKYIRTKVCFLCTNENKYDKIMET